MSGCFSDPGADLGIERALLSSSSVNVVSGSSVIGRPVLIGAAVGGPLPLLLTV